MTSCTQTLLLPTLKNILFATDFSECSQVAFPYLRSISERYGSTIHMVHVLAPEPMLEIPLDIIPEMDSDRDVALDTMKSILASKPFGQAPVTKTVKRGAIWPVLAAIIEEKHIDLIVLGTHGRRGLRKFMLGSVSEQIFRLARCPVLTVGPHAMDEAVANANFETILFATDFSYGSERALAYAESLARSNNSRLKLLYAVPPGLDVVSSSFYADPTTIDLSAKAIEDAIASAQEQMENLMPAEMMAELKPEMIVDYGPAAETILSVAQNKHASLIVLGAYHATEKSFVTHLPWATASKVVCEAHCPVLTVRN